MAETIDPRQRLENALVVEIATGSKLEHQRQRLLAITSAVADAVTTDEVFEAIVDRLGRAVDATGVAVWLLDADGRTARLARSVGYSESQAAAFATLALDSAQAAPPIDAIRRGEALWFASQREMLQAYPQLSAWVTPSRTYRVSCLPLSSNSRTLGVLALTHDEPRAEGEHDFLLLVARYAGQAIERLRLLAAERAAAVRMNILSNASRVFDEIPFGEPNRVDAIARALGTMLDSSVAIRLAQGDGRLDTIALHHPIPEAELVLRSLAATIQLRPGDGITGEVVRTGTSALVTSPEAIAKRIAPGYQSFYERFPTHAMMVAPLRARGRIIGTVAATRTRRGETYTADDLALLEALADRAAFAIENSRLHQEALAAGRRAEQLYRFLHAIVSVEQLDDVLAAALDAICAALGTERAAILLFDAAGVMRFRAARGLSAEYRAAVEGHSPWPRDASAPEPVLVPDVAADAGLASYLPLFRTERIGSLAFIPLVARGQLLGKFMVYHREPHEYSAAELELAGALASNLAAVTARFTAVAELEQTLHYNELFAGVLAHDLRNPLGAIMTASQLLLMRQEDERDRDTKPLIRILSSGQRMLRMIDQLLDVTRARVGGGIAIEPCATNLADVCQHVIGELELVYPDRSFHRAVTGDLDGVWDPDRLAQIISNLAANASQHGAGTEIAIRVDGSDPDTVAFHIHSAGAIPESLRATLFDPFRGTRHRRDHVRGLGLGLFIVKELVRAHRGTIEVTTSEADGTTFTVRLPRR